MPHIFEYTAFFLAGITLFFIFLNLKKRFLRYLRNRKFKRAHQKEVKAEKVLKNKGYKILEYQKRFYYDMALDNTKSIIELRPDYIVTKKRKIYVAEVKTGFSAPDIKNNKDTRRQILEYYFCIEIDGVLLVNMEEEAVYKIEFPNLKNKKHAFLKLCIIILFIMNFGFLLYNKLEWLSN